MSDITEVRQGDGSQNLGEYEAEVGFPLCKLKWRKPLALEPIEIVIPTVMLKKFALAIFAKEIEEQITQQKQVINRAHIDPKKPNGPRFKLP